MTATPSSAAAATNSKNNSGNNSRRKRKLANRSRHRLLSIDRDARTLKERALSALASDALPSSSAIDRGWPWLPNRSCGSWYLPPDASLPDVHFKSTDGHAGTHAVSLRRLNLPLLELLGERGGCFLVDSSVRKVLPDSFSRTIPLWCSAINRLVRRYRAELGPGHDGEEEDWDGGLHTPSCTVSPEEHDEMSRLIDSRVDLLYDSKAIVDPRRLVQAVTKPVRAVWITNGAVQRDTVPCSAHPGKFLTIVCCNPSRYFGGSSSKNHVCWTDVVSVDEDGGTSSRDSPSMGYYYTPGAADDDATWARRLTPKLWWANREKLIKPSRMEDETDALIDSIVSEMKMQQRDGNDDCGSTINADRIGDMNLWIGSRRAGRPPDCWGAFECVLNVTKDEYPNMERSIKERRAVSQKACYYLQLPVAEGKRDKSELERWMPAGLAFLVEHLRQDRRVLVHCAQGRDRSVAIVMAFVALFCPPLFPLRPRPKFETLSTEFVAEENDDEYRCSGLVASAVGTLLGETGRDIFLQRMRRHLDTPSNEPFATKDSLRIVLHLVKQDREAADPSRSTMQKLNRFFMSSPYQSK